MGDGLLNMASLGHDANEELRSSELFGVAERDLHRLVIVGGAMAFRYGLTPFEVLSSPLVSPNITKDPLF